MTTNEAITIARAAPSKRHDKVLALVGPATLSIVRNQEQTQYTGEIQYVIYRRDLVAVHGQPKMTRKVCYCDVSESGARKWNGPQFAAEYGPVLDAAIASNLWR